MRMLLLAVVLTAVALTTGCRSGLVMGPCTAIHSAYVESGMQKQEVRLERQRRADLSRRIMMSEAPQEKKEKAMWALSFGASDEEVMFSAGVDLMQVFGARSPEPEIKMSLGQKALHGACMLVDGVIAYAVGKETYEELADKDEKDGGGGSIQATNTGSGDLTVQQINGRPVNPQQRTHQRNDEKE